MRRPFVVANWKMHKTGPTAVAFASDLRTRIADECATRDVVVCPPYTSLNQVSQELEGSAISVGAQNMHWEENGAFTGEVSAPMLLTAGCTHVILGHSERRQLFGETDGSINQKLKTALRFGLSPVICVGETLMDREADNTEAVVVGQLGATLADIHSTDVLQTIIAYEPVWAIGTGRTATPEQAEDVHGLIRNWLRGCKCSEVADSVRIVYGGSVKPENAKELFTSENIDGGLIGGASLDAESFAAVVLATE